VASSGPGEIRCENASPEQTLGSPHASIRAVKHLTEFVHIVGCAVGQIAAPSRPHKLGGIEFGRVRGKVLDLDAGMLPEKRRDLTAAMDRPPIPEDHDGTAEMAEQGGEEGADVQTVERSILERQVEPDVASSRGHRQRRDRRKPVVFVEMVHARRAAARGPRAGHIGNEQKPGFINEHEMGATSCGVFLYAASAAASTPRSRLRRVLRPAAPVSGNSSPSGAAGARRDSDDTVSQTDAR